MQDFGFLILATILAVAILVAGGLFVSRYIFVVLAAFVLIFVWPFLCQSSFQYPFRSALLDALERSNAELRKTSRDNITANSKEIATFFPSHPTLEAAEGTLHKEGFSCGPLQGWSDTEIARWGQQYRRFKICRRRTYFHPLGSFGWQIYLFPNEVDVVENMSATRWYDGL